ncbi:MAG: SIR2 family NAD-dependent protein deacylase, partial [Planctomycetaceae bacterium]
MASSSSEFDPTLLQAISQRRLVPFVGAGVSVGVNKPRAKKKFLTWTELLTKLALTLSSKKKSAPAKFVKAAVEAKEWSMAAETALTHLGKSDFTRCVVDAVSVPRDCWDLSLPKAIWKLNPRVVVTTNYDHVLHSSAEQTNPLLVRNNCFNELRTLFSSSESRPAVWHLHGHMDTQESLILAPSQYQPLYSALGNSQSEFNAAALKLQELFSDKPILFIGFSMTDGYVLDAITKAMTTFRGNTEQRWALLKEGEHEEEHLWRRFGVQV